MKIGILGTGAYGIALATLLNKNHHEITMWTKFEEEKQNLVTYRKNDSLLPGVTIDTNINITTSIKEVCQEKELLIFAIPIAFFESTVKKVEEFYDPNSSICIATKGIEQERFLFAHEIIQKYISVDQIAVLSGPTFAKDLAQGNICAFTIASENTNVINQIKRAFATNQLVIETCSDILGVEICGSIKNVMAIACGILEGLNQSDSTKALFQKIALKELNNIIIQLGGQKETISTYAGIGDFLLTCNSIQSRNYTYGKKVGQRSADLQEYIEKTTIEGLYTLYSIKNLLQQKHVFSPIVEVLFAICLENQQPETLLSLLHYN